MSLSELGDEMLNVVHEARQILDKASKEGRNEDALLADECEAVNKLSARIPEIKKFQTMRQKAKDALMNLNTLEIEERPNGRGRTPRQTTKQKKERSSLVWNRGRGPVRAYDLTEFGTSEYRQAMKNYFRGFQNHGLRYEPDTQAGSTGMSVSEDSRGGYFVTSEYFAAEILKEVDDAVQIQAMSRVIMMPAGSSSYSIRQRRAKSSTFRWSAENADMTGIEDTSLRYGKRTMDPNWVDGSYVISKELIRKYPQADTMVNEEISVEMGEFLENAYLYGSGNQQSLGLLTPHDDGLPTSRDLPSSSDVQPSFDDIVDIKYSLKNRYDARAKWVLHRLILAKIAKLKDGEGQYLWRPSREVGSPDTIMGKPVVVSEYMPSAWTTGQYYCLYGDFSYHYILVDMGMQIQRLAEMRARTNEFEYLVRAKIDSQPVMAEAFTRGVVG